MAITNFVVENVDILPSKTGMNRIPETSDTLGSYFGAAIVTMHLQTAGFTYAGAAHATLLAVNAAIAAALRNNGTITMLGVAPHAPGDEASYTHGLWAKTLAISTNDITFVLCQAADQTTEHADGALGVINIPLAFYVSFKCAL